MGRAGQVKKSRLAEVIAFPINPELLAVRLAARQLERRQGPQADRYWKVECSRLHARLQTKGLCEAEITAEVDRFALAVHSEMQQAAWAEYALKARRPSGNDAA